jgi:hypothetical protein
MTRSICTEPDSLSNPMMGFFFAGLHCWVPPFIFAVMATTMTLPNNPIKSKLSTIQCLKTVGFHRTACASGRKLYSQCSFVHVAEPYLAKNFR